MHSVNIDYCLSALDRASQVLLCFPRGSEITGGINDNLIEHKMKWAICAVQGQLQLNIHSIWPQYETAMSDINDIEK